MLLGCKAETKVQDSPETLQALADCRGQVQEKDKYIKQLEEMRAEAELNKTADELIVTITGETMTITAKEPGKPTPTGSRAPKEEHIRSFIKQVQASRGAMQRCYQTALKKDTSLQVRSVDMRISVRLTATGKVGKATFNPSLGSGFNTCMTTVAKKWQVAGAPGGLTLQQSIKLSPQ
ncbi:MAG: hypothetical protein AAGC55_17015 [Myxococcota bacterium]